MNRHQQKKPKLKAISQAVSKFDNARRSILMYPEGHDAIKASIEEAAVAFTAILAKHSPLIIQAEKNNFSVENEILDMDQMGVKDFFSIAKQHGIAAIRFKEGLTPKELFHFLKSLSKWKELKGNELEDDKKKLSDKFHHVSVLFVDYSEIDLTFEHEVSATENDSREEKASPLHKSKGKGQKEHVYVINESPLEMESDAESSDPDTSLENISDYEKTLAEYMKKGQSESDPLASFQTETEGTEEGTIEKEEATRPPDISAQSEILQIFLKKLNPTLKNQFESFDFNKILKGELPDSLQKIFDGKEIKATFEALNKANEEDKEISPTLISLVKKMLSAMDPEITEIDLSHLNLEKLDFTQTKELRENIENLFEREEYENVIENEYERKIKELTDFSLDQSSFPMESYLETLKNDHIARQITKAMSCLIQEENTPEIYDDYLDCLIIIAKDLLEFRALDSISALFSLFKDHASHHPDKAIMSSAQKGVAFFYSPSCVEKLLDAIETEKTEMADAANMFLVELGENTVPAMIDLYLKAFDPFKREHLIYRLESYREETVFQIGKRLNASNLILDDHLLSLIIRFKDDSFLNFFRSMLENDDPALQGKALGVLLAYRDNTAIENVRKRIRSNNEALYLPAIFQAGNHQVKELIPDLIKTLKRSFFFMGDFTKKEAIVIALSGMQDSAILPVFENIVKKKLCMKPSRLRQLKIVIFQVLNRFPINDIQAFLEIGSLLDEPQIQAAMEVLFQEANGPLAK